MKTRPPSLREIIWRSLDFGMFYVSVDPHGKLGWESATLHYEDTTAHVIEVLTGQASNASKAFLRQKGISYILCRGGTTAIMSWRLPS